jgi:thiol:disulfide interchange protein DsbD
MTSTSITRFTFGISLAALLLISASNAALAQQTAAPPKPSDIVSTKTYVSMDPVPRGKDFQAAVVVKINPGYHMNSHKPSDSYLIPTTVTPQLPDGFTLVGEPSYPLGKNEKFPFSPDKPLNVYTEGATIRLKITASEKVALGKASIPVTLRFQACNTSACLPPVKIPLTLDLNVVEAGQSGKTVNGEIFPKSSYKKPSAPAGSSAQMQGASQSARAAGKS